MESCDGTFDYLDCGGSYARLYMWQNCTEPHTHTFIHTQMSACIMVTFRISSIDWIVPVSISWFWYCAVVVWDGGGGWGGGWGRGCMRLPCIFFL